jgi:hypothetical protein
MPESLAGAAFVFLFLLAQARRQSEARFGDIQMRCGGAGAVFKLATFAKGFGG